MSDRGGLEFYDYTVEFPAPSTHYAEVSAIFPAGGTSELELFLAVWTPGSYMVREYARHIEGVEASGPDRTPLPIRKTRKNRWIVETGGAPSVEVRYRVYGFDLSVRTNYIDENFALLNGAATFLSVVGKLDRTHRVSVILPPTWSSVHTGLPKNESFFEAGNYDQLVDSPILAGNPAVQEFAVEGKLHQIVHAGDTSLWDLPQVAIDVEKIVRCQTTMWGIIPYERYLFLNIVIDGNGRGGLEHCNSCCVISSRYTTRTRASYIAWLELMSHEFFHTWNVKRLRPVELGPFDYENENYTELLWVAEGFTEYYGNLILPRAGVVKPDEYLTSAKFIEEVETKPGRLAQTVTAASFDAWIKFYRPDENTINTAISYYVKGAAIAFLLDASLRAKGESLDNTMRTLYAKFSGPQGFTKEEMLAIFPEPWLRDALYTTKPLDYTAALQLYGLRFKQSPSKKAWLGFTTKTDKGQLIVTTVPRATPAYEAGFSPEDEILAINGYRVLPDQWAQRMEQYRPGEKANVLVSRRGKLVEVEAVLAQEPNRPGVWEIDPDATPEQKRQFNAWLGQPQ